MAARAAAVGRSTKNTSSKRPLRINSGGRDVMSFAVATTKTRPRFSASHVRKVPRTRCAAPVSPSEFARPFSISSIHTTHGAMTSAVARLSRSRRSDSPTYLSWIPARSSRSSGTPNVPAAALAANDLPQPWTPSSSTPRGGSRPGALPSKAGRLFASQSLSRSKPATSAGPAVSYSNERTPPRLSSSYLARITAGESEAVIAPSSKTAARASRRVSERESPARFSTRLFSAASSTWTSRSLALVHALAASSTIARRSSLDGNAISNRTLCAWRSSGSSSSWLTRTTVLGERG